MVSQTRPIYCFLSHAHASQEAVRIAAFIEQLTAMSKGSLEVLWDKDRTFRDISNFEALLDLCKAVILILTPEYRDRLLDENTGVGREFRRVMDLHRSRQLLVIPVQFSGVIPNILPSEIETIVCRDFRAFSVAVDDGGSTYIPDATITKYRSEIDAIVSEIEAAKISLSDQFEARLEDTLKRLFFDFKHESAGSDLPVELLERLFVKTSAYRAVDSRRAIMIVGRKGSGKSTLTDYISRIKPKSYYPPINVHLRDFDLNFTFNMYYSSRTYRDVETAFPEIDILECVWQVFFYSTCSCSAYLHIVNEVRELVEGFGEVVKFIREIDCVDLNACGGGHAIDYRKLLDWSFSRVLHVLEVQISSLRGKSEVLSSISSILQPRRIVNAIVGRPVMIELSRLSATHNRRFLFTLDGFDTKFNRFRMETLRLARAEQRSSSGLAATRLRFERNWLGSLHEVLLWFDGITRPQALAFPLEKSIDFCVTVPKDRFLELRKSDRDSYRDRMRNVDIAWSGIDLMNMLRKRLEVYFKYDTRKSGTPIEKFDEILRRKLPDLPRVISFGFNGRSVSIDLFSYILRHSFWRPRDVLFYFADILAFRDEINRTNKKVTEDHIRTRIKMKTSEVIKTEFILEFSSVCLNIQEVVELFRRSRPTLAFPEVSEKIGETRIDFASGEAAIDMYEKIKFLYEIGFIGFELGRELRAKFHTETNQVFSFSDGDEFVESIEEEDFKALKYIIHPAFMEILNLDASAAPFLLHYDVEYLKKRDEQMFN